ncbi:MAG: hypothetical protein IKP64_03775 [Selenomonadaceae bacterium]|nr:hypothetical protein [Selenomonadaceae bacterium]
MFDVKKIPAWFVITFCAGTFLIMNLLLPIIGDDYAYAFIWDGAQNGNFQNNLVGQLQRVESFGDIFYSQWQHYLTWGGRTVAHCFVQFFVWQGKLLFDVANALMYAALALMIYFFGTGKFDFKNMSGAMLLWIFFAMWFCLPEIYQTALWLTGSCNYLWMSVLQLAFLIPFAKKFWQENFWSDSSTGKIFLMTLFGIVAGWSNESGGAMIIFLTFLALIYFWRKKQFERWMLAGFVGLFVGYALLMLAPGNFQRYIVDANDATVPFLSAQMFIDNFQDGMEEILWDDVLLYVVTALYLVRGKRSVEATQFILAFAAAGILLPCLLMFSPEFPARAAFLSPVLAMIASVTALERTQINLSPKIISAALIVWLATVVYTIGVDWSIHSQIAERQVYVEQHKHDDLIVLQPIYLPYLPEHALWSWTIDSYVRFYGDVTPYRDEFNNRNITYAQYYGLKEVVLDAEANKKLTQYIYY